MPYRMLCIGASLFLAALSPATLAETRCTAPLATLVSAEGQVEAGTADGGWRAARGDEHFCAGDRVRVGANSRAAVVLDNHTVVRLDALTTLNFTGPRERDSLWVELVRGIGHFMSRVPRRLTVSTPYVNAGVEGTEFLVTADDTEGTVTVFEGTVAASNAAGQVRLGSGESVAAAAGAAPVVRLVLRPRDALQWALYYPPVVGSDATASGAAAEWQARLAGIEATDSAAALAALAPLGDGIDDPRFFVHRASLYLGTGRVAAARADIDRALALDPNDGDALALQAVIALAHNDKDQALTLAQQAVAAAPRASGPQLALSYAWQAQFELERARAAAEQAVALAPRSALAHARLAELHLMFGDHAAATTAAREAVALDPALARAQAVLGYAHLGALRLDDAHRAFERAAALDPGDPLPQLGLGLVAIRAGQLAAGRQHVEIAASLDPDAALVRSYLGKAYYEERRDARAETQLEIAKALDPNDPTPWFYDAILEQRANRPAEALHDVQAAIALNDNRAVYRSRLLLDSDAAARSASLARIYDDLGFGQLALVEAWKSLAADPTNHSAHRFVADAYTALPRHEAARVSEVLQAQLLQPVYARPVRPSAAETSLFALEGAGPTRAAYNEFTPLFARDRIALEANLSAGNNATFADEAVVFGNYRRLAASLGQFRYSSDGYRDNNDFEQNVYDAFVQYDVSDATSAQLEWRRRDIEGGDVAQRFGADNFDTLLRQDFDEETARVGFRHDLTPRHTVLGSVIYDRQERHDASSPDSLDALTEGYHAELQAGMRYATHHLVVGAGHADQRRQALLLFDFAGFTFPIEDSSGDREDNNVYAYDTFTPLPKLHVTLGASYDRLSSEQFDAASGLETRDERKQVNPKLGVLWLASPHTALRIAAFRTLRRLTHANQTIEPTQVAGFNQFFDDLVGTDARRYGIGLDHQFSPQLFAGVELSRRDSEKPVIDAALGAVTEVGNHELMHRAYLYRLLGLRWNVAAEYFFTRYTSDFTAGAADPRNPIELTTHYLPLSLNYHAPHGFFGRATLNLMAQHAGFSTETGVANDRSHFTTADLTLGYRLAGYRTVVSVTAQNIFDTQFDFHDTSLSTETPTPLLARFRPERSVFANVAFWF